MLDGRVGHGERTRATSYTKPSREAMRAAVEKVLAVAGLADGPA